METVYTRLRNELAHQRAGVNLDNTKAEMSNRLSRLIALTKRAIELQVLETRLILAKSPHPVSHKEIL